MQHAVESEYRPYHDREGHQSCARGAGTPPLPPDRPDPLHVTVCTRWHGRGTRRSRVCADRASVEALLRAMQEQGLVYSVLEADESGNAVEGGSKDWYRPSEKGF
jgi:hypothetical protein